MSQHITIHQALHGYRSGHRLVASSTGLSAEDRRYLAIATDSADAGRVPGWNALVSGYPLPSRSWYCLSATWLAGHATRPGSVWTHSLLLDAEAIRSADWMNPFSLFKRPESDSEIDAFNSPIAVERSDGPFISGGSQTAAEVSWTLFQPPTAAVEFVTDLHSEARIEALFRIWTQLWPEERATWRFAEAPTARRVDENGERFDLLVMARPQGVPDTNVRILNGPLLRNPPQWAEAFARLDRGEPDSLHDFLDAYAPGATDPRESISGLSDLWSSLAASSVRAAVETLNEIAPEPSELARLKSDLAVRARVAGLHAETSSLDLLAAILETRSAAFDSEELISSLAGHFLPLLDVDAIDLLDVALRNSGSLLSGAIVGLAARHVESGASYHPGQMAALVKAKPYLASQPSLWRTVGPADIWSAVRGSVRAHEARKEIVRAAIDAEASISPSAVLAAWPETGTAALDALLDTSRDTGYAEPWIAALPASAVSERLRALADDHPERLDFLLAAVPFTSLAEFEIADLSRLVELTERPSLQLVAFLTAIESTESIAPDLATRTFAGLYPLAAGSGLGDARRLLDTIDVDVPVWDPQLRLARLLNRFLYSTPRGRAAAFNLKKAPFRALIGADSKAELAQRLAEVSVDPKGWQARELSEVISKKADREGVKATLEALFSRLRPF